MLKGIEEWKYEIKLAKQVRDVYLRHWKYWQEMYDDNPWTVASFRSGRVNARDIKNQNIPSVNEAEQTIMSILPSILHFEPVFEVVPVDNVYSFSAMVYEQLCKALYNLYNIDDYIEQIAIDALLLGAGVHKIGYSETSDDAGVFNAGVSQMNLTEDAIFSRDVCPIDMLWDSRAKTWEDKLWIAQEFIKPLEIVKDSDIYINTRTLRSNVDLETEAGITQTLPKSPELGNVFELVKLIEIHDLYNGKIITISEDHDKYIRNDEYGYDEELFTPLTFIPTRPRRFWGKSIMQSIEEHVMRLSRFHYYVDSHSKRSGMSKTLFDKGRIDKEAQRALRSSNDFELVGIDGDISTAVEELKMAQVGGDWFAIANMLEQTIRQQTGVTLQARGRHEPGVETAYEAAKLFESSDLRNAYRIKKLNNFIAKIMNKIMKIVAANWPSEKIFATLGLPVEQAAMLMPYDNMKLQVKYGSTALAERDEKLKRVMSFVQAVASLGMQVNPQEFAKMMSDALGLEISETMLLLAPPSGGGQPSSEGQGMPQPTGRVGNAGGGQI